MGAREVDVVLNVHEPGYEEDIEETALRRLLRLQGRSPAGLLDGKLLVRIRGRLLEPQNRKRKNHEVES